MKCRGRPQKKPRSLHLSVSATDVEWETVRRNATRRRKSMVRYLVELVLGEDGESSATDGDGQWVALDRGEQREMLETLRRLTWHVGDGDILGLLRDPMNL